MFIFASISRASWPANGIPLDRLSGTPARTGFFPEGRIRIGATWSAQNQGNGLDPRVDQRWPGSERFFPGGSNLNWIDWLRAKPETIDSME